MDGLRAIADHGLLSDVCKHTEPQVPGIGHWREWAKFDAMFGALAGQTKEKDLIGREEGGYPGRIYALIECENDQQIEEEMYKLLWWRAPLKVLLSR